MAKKVSTKDDKKRPGKTQKKKSASKQAKSTASSKKAQKNKSRIIKQEVKGKKTSSSRSVKVVPKKKSSSPSKTAQRTKKSNIKSTSKVIKNNKDRQLKDYEVSDSDSMARGDVPMTVVDHLDEFRSRLLISLIVIIVLTIGAFFVSEYILTFLMKPFLATGQKLNIFKLAGGFIIRLKVSVAVALIVGVPVFIYQIWRFILPAISVTDRVFSRLSILAAVLLFYGGVSFVFFLLLPFAIPMLLSFIMSNMHVTIGADDYLSFILIMSVAMGVLFELPIIVMVLTKVGILSPQFLIKKRKYSIVIIWIVAALITPQDIWSQVMVAVPLMFLYEISIIISRSMFLRKHKKDILNKAK